MTAQNSNISTASSRPHANVALGYVRGRFNDLPTEFLKSLFEEECKKRGWQLAFYQDIDAPAYGFCSYRPALLALKQRAKDANVVAVLVYDLSHLSRRTSTVVELINQLVENQIRLVVTTSTRVLETSTPFHVTIAG